MSSRLSGKQIYELFVGKSPFENPYSDCLAWELNCTIGELPPHWRCRFNFENLINPDGLRLLD